MKGVIEMEQKSRGLKNRIAISNSVDKELWTRIKDLHDKTKVPISKLLDEAMGDLLAKRKGS